MSKKSTNIWDEFDFSEQKKMTALDYLNKLKQGFLNKTGGELILTTEAVDAYIDGTPPKLGAIYKLFVEAPKLGGYRRKILSIAEYNEKGRFPVDIINHLSNNEKFENIQEEEIDEKIEEILKNKFVKNSIEDLYRQSKEVDNN